nr:hypothetical protein CFP56_64955 [Quercus suber]
MDAEAGRFSFNESPTFVLSTTILVVHLIMLVVSLLKLQPPLARDGYGLGLGERSKEKALLTFISSTLSPSILALIVDCASVIEVWKILENRFSSISRSHIMNLKGELHNLKKGDDIINLYLPKIKVVWYKDQKYSIFDELLTMLNAEEESLNESLDVKDPIFAMAAAATSKPNGNSYNQ